VTDEPLGSHVLELQVADVVDETADARSLVFKVPDGSTIPADRLRYAPGQFLTLRVPSDRTGSVARCYSLCSSPFTDDALTVTVKRTVDGYASNWLCDNAHAGMKIHVLAPSGTFVPKTLDTDFLLLAAGSGITPMMAILKSALSEGGGKVGLIYANRDEKSVIFAAPACSCESGTRGNRCVASGSRTISEAAAVKMCLTLVYGIKAMSTSAMRP